MDAAVTLFAGLGLFFIGVRLAANHLKQLASRRLRRLVQRAVAGGSSSLFFGLAAGAIMQSVNAVTHVLVALVSAGALERRRALPIIGWANIGTSLLVLIAAIDLHLAVLLLIGLIGIAYYLNLDQSARHRHLVGALLGLGLLFLGIDFIKAGAAPLKSALWLRELIALSSSLPPVSFLLGVLVAMIAQSSATVTVVAMAMASAGVLPFAAGGMIVAGASLGSGLSAWLMAGGTAGSARQLILYQLVLKAAGVLAVLTLLLGERYAGLPLLHAAFTMAGLAAASELAVLYLLLQLAAEASLRPWRAAVERLLERRAPPSEEEVLGKPRYLQDDALVEPETALLLVDREQLRLLAALPDYLDELRSEGPQGGPRVAVRQAAEANVARLCAQFLTELTDRSQSREVLERSIVLRDRNDLLLALQETLAELARVGGSGDDTTDETRLLLHNLVESLHLMLITLADAQRGNDVDELALLRHLTHDRSELMDGIRRRLLGGGLSPSVQEAAFAATTLFERAVWLLRRYVLLLEAGRA